MRPIDKLVRDVHVHLAARFKEERERQGLSMQRVAESAGVSQQMVSYFERGLRNPSLDTLIRIAGVLKVDLPSLLDEALRR